MRDEADQRAPLAIAGHKTLDLDAMSETELADLCKTLYAVHATVFKGLSEEEFFDHVLKPPAERNLLRLYLDPEGNVIGYCALHRFRRTIGGRECAVLRAEAGLLPEYRGRGSIYWFGMVLALQYKLRHPLQPLYYLGTLVHTSSYHLFAKYFPKMYPLPYQPVPSDIRAFTTELIESFDSPAVTPDDPFVRDVGWITIETPRETEMRQTQRSPDTVFFTERNPGYPMGHGLVVLAPLTFRNLSSALARRITEALRDRLGRRPSSQ